MSYSYRTRARELKSKNGVRGQNETRGLACCSSGLNRPDNERKQRSGTAVSGLCLLELPRTLKKNHTRSAISHCASRCVHLLALLSCGRLWGVLICPNYPYAFRPPALGSESALRTPTLFLLWVPGAVGMAVTHWKHDLQCALPCSCSTLRKLWRAIGRLLG